MAQKSTLVLMYAALVLLIGLFTTSCETGVDSSPEPGIIKIVLKTDPSDTLLVVINDTLSLNDTVRASYVYDSTYYDTATGKDTTVYLTGYRNQKRPVYFPQIVFQGRAYQDSLFTILLNSVESYRQSDDTVNVFLRNETTDEFVDHTIYESYVPPGDYTKIEFGLKSSNIYVYPYFVPVALPTDAKPQVSLERNFQVRENTTTEIVVQLKPLQSIERYRDSYFYNRKIEIIDVRYY